MRQVPHYLLIGSGRVATHMQAYFSALALSFSTWSRSQSLETLAQVASAASHILILISDDAIDPFISKHLAHSNAFLIHFSGSLISHHAYGAHPLMSFSETLYSLSTYQSIPFILEEDAPSMAELLPGLKHPHGRLPKKLKAKYHALCVLSGNFSCLLWQAFLARFENEFALDPELLYPYLQQQTVNLVTNPEGAFTGPLMRGDKKTIEKNLAALQGDPLQALYQAFVQYYQMK